MSMTTNSLVALVKKLAVPAGIFATVLFSLAFFFDHSKAHAAAAGPLDESSVSSLIALDNAVEAVASRVTPAVVNVAVTSRVSEDDQNSENGGQGLAASITARSAARLPAVLLWSPFFAIMALLLAAVGLYAVLSYMVAQRTLEIGLRLALGAQRESVMRLILGRGMMLAAIGLAIGVAASLVLTRFMSEMLYGVKPLDPLTFLTVSAVLMLVSVLASTAPAYRAARLDPMRTLREQ